MLEFTHGNANLDLKLYSICSLVADIFLYAICKLKKLFLKWTIYLFPSGLHFESIARLAWLTEISLLFALLAAHFISQLTILGYRAHVPESTKHGC
jgi:hypothetical protein